MQYPEVRLWLENQGEARILKYENAVITDTRLPIRGIRMPVMRQTARELSRGPWQQLLQQAQWDSFEEVLLLGLTAAYAKLPFEQKIPYIRQLLPHLDSWAHTDSIAPTLKPLSGELESVWNFAVECLESEEEYTVRFGILLFLDYFIDTGRLPQVLELLTDLHDERYYVRMAQAWCLAEIAVKHPQPVLDALKSGKLDCFTHNKTIQKMRESYRILPEYKEAAAALKRKERKNEENHGN